jgi:uncharacterized protein (TIGR02452 family)
VLHPSSNPTQATAQTTQFASSAPIPAKKLKPRPQLVAILNMASPLRPGGGLLRGAASQEEFLCLRTTLYHSLHEAFYRLPEAGLLWTPDVMVFRTAAVAAAAEVVPGMLRRRERFYVGVVTAGMLRFPEVEGGRYVRGKERELAIRKVRGVVRVIAGKGVRGAVLGAWGCGAYGNPVGEVVAAWKKALVGEEGKGGKGGRRVEAEPLGQLEEVVFAINDRKMAEEFAKHWGGGIEVERVERVVESEVNAEPEEDEEMELWKKEMEELEEKIKELEVQRTEAKFPARIDLVLNPLKKQHIELESRKPRPEEHIAEVEQHAEDDSSDESDHANARTKNEDDDFDDDYDQAYSSEAEGA